MASLWKHPNSPYWTACYTNSLGRQVKRSTKQKNSKLARKIAEAWEEAEAKGRARQMTTIQIQKFASDLAERVVGDAIEVPTVENFLNDWLAAKKAKDSSAGTIERYGNTIRLFIDYLGEFAKAQITSVAPKHIDGFMTHRLKEGRAPKTVVVDIKTLRTAFNRAFRYGIILNNPVNAVELPASESMERELFSHKEVGDVLAAAHKWDREWVTVILLGYYTGARLGDCARMKWENVNLKEHGITFVQGKTGKRVNIPTHIDLEEHLGLIYDDDALTDFISPGLAARTSGGKHGLSESFKRLVVRAGLDTMTVKGKGSHQFSRRTFHSLRYSFNSALANAGVSQEIRVKFTGHSSNAMNDRYTKLDQKPLGDAIKKLPNLDED